jgi:hypothetical protein
MSTMKKFEQLPQREQEQVIAVFLHAVIKAVGHDAPIQDRRAEAAIEAIGCTALEFWDDALADAGLDKCEPWEGYPKKFAIFPDRPRIDLSDYSKN